MAKIKLLIITNVFTPDTCGAAQIYADMAHWLATQDMDVTVRCAYPYYPEWRDKSSNNGFSIETSHDDNITVERYGLYIPKNPRSLIQRLFYEASYLASISRSLFWSKSFDATIVVCPLMGSVALGAMIKMLFRQPALLCVQDLPADAAASSGITKSRKLKSIFKRIQSLLFNQYDAWHTINPIMKLQLEDIRTNGRGLCEVLLIPNWLHSTLATAISRLPSKLGRVPGSPVKLLYSGNIGAKQGLLDYCQVLHRSDAQFDFAINSEGAGATQVAEWVRSVGDNRFRPGPFLSEAGFAQAMHDADYFVITEKPGLTASFFPSKSIPAMVSGTPIMAVSSPHSPLGVEMLEHKVGPWFAWEDTTGMQNVLIKHNAQNFVRWQHNAVARSEYYDRQHCLEAFRATVLAMVNGNGVECLTTR